MVPSLRAGKTYRGVHPRCEPAEWVQRILPPLPQLACVGVAALLAGLSGPGVGASGPIAGAEATWAAAGPRGRDAGAAKRPVRDLPNGQPRPTRLVPGPLPRDGREPRPVVQPLQHGARTVPRRPRGAGPGGRILEDGVLCAALAAYYEARGEPYEGQIAVAQVAVRRAGFRVERICAEVYRPAQFSFTAERPRGSALPHRDDPTWRRAQRAARAAILWGFAPTVLPDYSGGATHYTTTTIRPAWARRMAVVAVIDNHRFYR